MSKEIDWSKAPEGYPLWLEGTSDEHRKHNGWYKEAGPVFLGADGGQWRSAREGQFFTVHHRPEPAPWTGEGLPPVGTVCEARVKNGRHWIKCTVLALTERFMIAREGVGDEFSMAHIYWEFRAILTAEQIAAEERRVAVNELADLLHDAAAQGQNEYFLARMVIGLGYRKCSE